MLPLPDARPFAGFSRPALMAVLAAAAAVAAGVALLERAPVGAAAAAAVFLLATLSGWAASLVRRDAIRDTATSTASGAALGYVELTGIAETGAEPALRSQIAKRPCVWYRYRIERRVGASWMVESSESSEDCFLLHDATGDCVVDPEGAEIVSRRQRRWREFGHRYREQWIAPGDRLYVLGELVSVGGALDSPTDLTRDVSAMLAEWKRDLVRRALSSRGIERVEIRPTVTSPPGSRRRATFGARRTRKGTLVGFHAAASTFCSTCSGLVAPAITLATAGLPASQPNAISSSVRPRSAANAWSFSTTFQLASTAFTTIPLAIAAPAI